MRQRNKEGSLLEGKLWAVIPEGVGILSRDFPALQNHQHCPPFPDGAFEEQRTGRSELLMSAFHAGGGITEPIRLKGAYVNVGFL